MQVTYKVEGEPLEQLPDAYSEHYVQVGFWRDYTQGYDKKETFSHANAQSSDEHNAEYKEGYTAGYEAGYHDGEEQATGNEKHFARFSGSFTATVEQILPDYYALPGKTVAVVHFFQDRPFLLHFQKDLTGELIEGTAYVFEFETFEVELPDDEENPNISDYMYSINVTSYRVAEDDELGLEGKMPTVEIVSK